MNTMLDYIKEITKNTSGLSKSNLQYIFVDNYEKFSDKDYNDYNQTLYMAFLKIYEEKVDIRGFGLFDEQRDICIFRNEEKNEMFDITVNDYFKIGKEVCFGYMDKNHKECFAETVQDAINNYNTNFISILTKSRRNDMTGHMFILGIDNKENTSFIKKSITEIIKNYNDDIYVINNNLHKYDDFAKLYDGHICNEIKSSDNENHINLLEIYPELLNSEDEIMFMRCNFIVSLFYYIKGTPLTKEEYVCIHKGMIEIYDNYYADYANNHNISKKPIMDDLIDFISKQNQSQLQKLAILLNEKTKQYNEFYDKYKINTNNLFIYNCESSIGFVLALYQIYINLWRSYNQGKYSSWIFVDDIFPIAKPFMSYLHSFYVRLRMLGGTFCFSANSFSELVSDDDGKNLVGQSPYHLYLNPMEEEKKTINHYMGETISKYPILIS